MTIDANSPRGALPAQHIQSLVDKGVIRTELPLAADQIQPASLDLRLGQTAYRIRSSFLPGIGKTVSDCLTSQLMHEIDLSEGAVLEKSCVYLVPLLESLDLPEYLSGAANPKSSTGRLDILTRLITDEGVAFEQIEAGYSGPLYAEIVPLTFSVLVRTGSRLSQLRLRQGKSQFTEKEHILEQQRERLVDRDFSAAELKDGVPIGIDLTGDSRGGLIGYRAKRHSRVIDVDRSNGYPINEFWDPIYTLNGQLILDPGEFYILVSNEAVKIPVACAAEMVAYDTSIGEFRVHYAGFFDPGFGVPNQAGRGARAVLEIRSFDVPFLLEHAQIVGRLRYEHMLETPNIAYGQALASNYQSQGLKLSKHFFKE